jgi:hypothetical protein
MASAASLPPVSIPDNNTATSDSSSSSTAQVANPLVNSDAWWYLDSSMAPQGPFKFAQMDAWWRAGYFAPDLKVCLIILEIVFLGMKYA